MGTGTERLELDLPPGSKQIIEQAAELLGLTVADFAGSRLVSIAHETLREHHVTRLTTRDRDLFLAMLDGDARPNAALRQAFRDVH